MLSIDTMYFVDSELGNSAFVQNLSLGICFACLKYWNDWIHFNFFKKKFVKF